MRLSLPIAFACLAVTACAAHSPTHYSQGSGGGHVSLVEVVMLAPQRRPVAQLRRAQRPQGYRAPTSLAAIAPRSAPVRSRIITRSDGLEPATPDVRPPAAHQLPGIPDALAPRVGDGEIVLPYSIRNMFRGYGRCKRSGRHHHEAIDLGGVGPDYGLGTPVRSMTRARVTFIGRPEDDAGEFGRRDKRRGTVTRGRRELPRSKTISGYGRVHFFTRTKGRWRSGVVVVTQGLGGRLDGHTVRYMHLGAVHPSLRVGDVLAPGQELGLMGGTGVQESAPHVHIDIADPGGQRIDVAPLLGLEPTRTPCHEGP